MSSIFSFVVLSVVFLSSCANETPPKYFYSDTKRGDLWRFPLIDPYEIVSPTNSHDWNLIIKKPNLYNKDYFNPGADYEFQLPAIDSVGIKDSIIVLKSGLYYWPKLSGDYKTTLLINTKTNEQLIFSMAHHQKEFNRKMHDLKIESIKLYSFEEIKNTFQSHLKLPEEWHR